MSQLQTALHNDVQLLKLLRDELALQAHLFKAEARDRWQQLEPQWQALCSRVDEAKSAAVKSEGEAEASLSLLVDSLKTGYANIRNALKR